MQNVSFTDLYADLQKNMMISIVKIKLYEAKALMKKAEIQLEKAVKYGTGQQIYDSAYEHTKAKDRYLNLNVLYQTIIKGV